MESYAGLDPRAIAVTALRHAAQECAGAGILLLQAGYCPAPEGEGDKNLRVIVEWLRDYADRLARHAAEYPPGSLDIAPADRV